uniref:PRELI domain-containing protein 1, mitochondrial-like n=1 Tax=Oncorhynchus kisutch TaxID=8019 RepID=A0A8C7KR11_ONCKI
MVKYFSNDVDIRTTWDHVVSAFWQRYPNPFSTHVLTEDVVLREVTADQRLLSRRLLTKTNRMPRWAEFLFPSNLSRSVYIVEDSVVDPVTKSLTTYTWNLNHTTLMTVEERCVFQESEDRPAFTLLRREAWISSGVYGFSRPIQVQHRCSTEQHNRKYHSPRAAIGQASPRAAIGQASPRAAIGQASPRAAIGQASPRAAIGQASPRAAIGQAQTSYRTVLSPCMDSVHPGLK